MKRLTIFGMIIVILTIIFASASLFFPFPSIVIRLIGLGGVTSVVGIMLYFSLNRYSVFDYGWGIFLGLGALFFISVVGDFFGRMLFTPSHSNLCSEPHLTWFFLIGPITYLIGRFIRCSETDED